MKNCEKYAEEIKNLQGVEWCNIFAKRKVLEPMGRLCENTNCALCQALTTLWLLKEYEEAKEPKVDWSKVAVDTPILVRTFEHCDWCKRYFAKCENGKVFAWGDGRTSWNSESTDDVTYWKYAKLAETEVAE